LLHWVWDALEHRKVFRRERKTNWLRALGIVLYHLGLSLRDASMVLCLFDEASHEAVREWYGKARALFEARRRPRRALAVDETKVKVRGRWMYVWAAIDVDRWEVLATWITEGRSMFEASSFLRKALSYCDGMPTVYVDGAPWYRWALDRLGVPWEHRTFGPRAPVEQWYGIYKHRIRRFYRRWPHNASLDQADAWTRSFVSCYNLRRLGGLS
jgi:putative transposase